MSSPIVLYTRLTHADKLPDRFLASQVYRPADPESRLKGVIFGQIEILNPWFPANQIGQTIINTLIREYYRATYETELDNFEAALKKVNETLSEISKAGETGWVGHLNGVLMLINNQDIHISQTGDIKAHIFRDSEINHLTEGLINDDDPHPLRTFSNITSGTLKLKDKIVIANPDFYDNISMKEIAEVISENVPAVAVLDFVQTLKHKKSLSAGALVIELTTQDAADALPLEYKTDTIYIDQGANSAWLNLKHSFNKVGKPALGAMKSNFQKSLKKADYQFDTYIIPPVKKASKKSYDFAKQSANKIKERFRKRKTLNESVGIPTDMRSAISTHRPKLNIKLPPKVSQASDKLKPVVAKPVDWTKSKLGLSGIETPEGRAKRVISWGIALLVILVILIILGRQEPTTDVAYSPAIQETATDLNEKFAHVKLTAAYNDKSAALTELAEIFDTLNELSQKGELPPSLQELEKQATEELKKLTDTKLASDVVALADSNNNKLVVNYENSQYFISDNQIVCASDNSTIDISQVGSVYGAVADIETKQIVLSTQNGLYRFKPADKQITSITVQDNNWTNTSLISTFSGNIYGIDLSQAKIIKLTPSGDEYSNAGDFGSPSGDELKNAESIAINSSILTLMNDGQIIAYSRTAREAMTLTGMPVDSFVKEPIAIFSNYENIEVAIVHKDIWLKNRYRLTNFNKNGEFMTSYLLPQEIGSIKATEYDLSTKTLYIITDSKIYSTQATE